MADSAAVLHALPTELIERPRLSRPLPKTLSRETVVSLVEAPDVASVRGLRESIRIRSCTGFLSSRRMEGRHDTGRSSLPYELAGGDADSNRIAP